MCFRSFLFALGLCVAACKPLETPKPENGTPVFGLQATVNSQPLNWNAGDSGFFQFTGRQTTVPVTYWGELAQENGGLPPGKLYLALLDTSTCTQPCTDLLTSLVPGFYPVDGYQITSNQPKVRMRFVAETYGQTGVSYQWTFSDGQTAAGPNVQLDFPASVITQNYQADLVVTNTQGASSSLSNRFTADSTNRCQLSWDFPTPTGVLAYAFTAPTGYGQYLWNFANGTVSQNPNDSTFFLNDGPFRICLNASGGTCQSVTYCRSLWFGSSAPPSPVADFTTNYLGVVPPGSSIRPLRFLVRYTAPDGTEYQSTPPLGATIPQNPQVEVLEVTPYELNAANQPTLRLRVRMNLTLYATNGNGGTLNFQTNDWRTAIALP